MPSNQESVVVKTTIPEYQKERWVDLADEFEVSQSEFIRLMVQAGIHWFDLETAEPTSPDANPRGNALRTRVLDVLPSEGYMSFEDLLEAVSGDIETNLEETIETLAAEDLVTTSVRRGVARNGAPDGAD
ncbi:MAG: DUF5805 domain-containing protein [Halobacteriales archaeon]|nr:DUF5805 domain-containing protein [Halobacteriales archaeon]